MFVVGCNTYVGMLGAGEVVDNHTPMPYILCKVLFKIMEITSQKTP